MKMSILKYMYFSRGKSKRPDTSSSSASAISESDESNCEIVEVEDSEEPQLSPLAVPIAVVRNDIGTFMEDIAKGAISYHPTSVAKYCAFHTTFY